jgi:hypothetical protein
MACDSSEKGNRANVIEIRDDGGPSTGMDIRESAPGECCYADVALLSGSARSRIADAIWFH